MGETKSLYGLSGDLETQQARRLNFGTGSVLTLLAAFMTLVSLMNVVQSASLLGVLLSAAAGVALVWGFLNRRGPSDRVQQAVALAYALNAAASISAAAGGHAAAGTVLPGFLPLMLVWNRRGKRQS